MDMLTSSVKKLNALDPAVQYYMVQGTPGAWSLIMETTVGNQSHQTVAVDPLNELSFAEFFAGADLGALCDEKPTTIYLDKKVTD